jgi:hypothetical protein
MRPAPFIKRMKGAAGSGSGAERPMTSPCSTTKFESRTAPHRMQSGEWSQRPCVGLSSPPSASQRLSETESKTLGPESFDAPFAWGEAATGPCNRKNNAATRAITARAHEIESRESPSKAMQKL